MSSHTAVCKAKDGENAIFPTSRPYPSRRRSGSRRTPRGSGPGTSPRDSWRPPRAIDCPPPPANGPLTPGRGERDVCGAGPGSENELDALWSMRISTDSRRRRRAHEDASGLVMDFCHRRSSVWFLQGTRGVHPMPVWCWAIVCDAGPASNPALGERLVFSARDPSCYAALQSLKTVYFIFKVSRCCLLTFDTVSFGFARQCKGLSCYRWDESDLNVHRLRYRKNQSTVTVFWCVLHIKAGWLCLWSDSSLSTAEVGLHIRSFYKNVLYALIQLSGVWPDQYDKFLRQNNKSKTINMYAVSNTLKLFLKSLKKSRTGRDSACLQV